MTELSGKPGQIIQGSLLFIFRAFNVIWIAPESIPAPSNFFLNPWLRAAQLWSCGNARD